MERRTTPGSGPPAREVRSDRAGGAYRSAAERSEGAGDGRRGGPGLSEGPAWAGPGPWPVPSPRRGRSRCRCRCRAIPAVAELSPWPVDRWSRQERRSPEGQGESGAADSRGARTAPPRSPRGRPRRGPLRTFGRSSCRSWLGRHLDTRPEKDVPPCRRGCQPVHVPPLCSHPTHRRDTPRGAEPPRRVELDPRENRTRRHRCSISLI